MVDEDMSATLRALSVLLGKAGHCACHWHCRPSDRSITKVAIAIRSQSLDTPNVDKIFSPEQRAHKSALQRSNDLRLCDPRYLVVIGDPAVIWQLLRLSRVTGWSCGELQSNGKSACLEVVAFNATATTTGPF
jgi:hypothetical protein